MEFCYMVLNSALVLKAVPLVTREKKPLAPRVHQTTHCLQNLELVTTYKALNGLPSGYITNLIDGRPYAIPTIPWLVVHWKFQVQTPFRLETVHSALQRQNWGIILKTLKTIIIIIIIIIIIK